MAQIQTKFIADLAVTNAKIANATINLTTKVTGALPLINGGTGTAAASANAAFNALSPLTTKGDLIGFSTVNARLAVGTNGQVLSADSAQATGLSWINAATGTVTSVALTVPAFLSVAGSPVTTSGTLAVTFSGSAIPIANGGTNATTAAAAFNNLNPMTTTGDLIYESATNVASRLPIGSTSQVLTVVGGIPAWAAPASAPTLVSENITLSGTDITNQYVDLAHPATGASASVNSVSVFIVGGPMQQKTVDYTVSLTGGVAGVTRITFAGDLATGGAAALVATDILVAEYEY